MALSAVVVPACGASSSTNERVFVGRLISTTLRPEHNRAAERAFAKAHPDMLRIDNGCARASTVYAVITEHGDTTDHMTVHSSIGEWCDMPAGMDGFPALVDVVRRDGRWWVRHAYAFQSTRDGRRVMIPSGDPVICGIRLWDLRSALDPYDSRIDVGEELPGQRKSLVVQGILHRRGDGSLIYASAIRMRDLLRALEHSPCRLKPTDMD
jgi:hypothetical protein